MNKRIKKKIRKRDGYKKIKNYYISFISWYIGYDIEKDNALKLSSINRSYTVHPLGVFIRLYEENNTEIIENKTRLIHLEIKPKNKFVSVKHKQINLLYEKLTKRLERRFKFIKVIR